MGDILQTAHVCSRVGPEKKRALRCAQNLRCFQEWLLGLSGTECWVRAVGDWVYCQPQGGPHPVAEIEAESPAVIFYRDGRTLWRGVHLLIGVPVGKGAEGGTYSGVSACRTPGKLCKDPRLPESVALQAPAQHPTTPKADI